MQVVFGMYWHVLAPTNKNTLTATYLRRKLNCDEGIPKQVERDESQAFFPHPHLGKSDCPNLNLIRKGLKEKKRKGLSVERATTRK